VNGTSALVEVQLMLARWKNPSAWDRIGQDEPLDPVKGEWVPAVTTASTSGQVQLPTTTASTMSLGVVQTLNGVEDRQYLMTLLSRGMDYEIIRALDEAADFSRRPISTQAPGQHWETETWNSQGNIPVRHQVAAPGSLPYARNREENRALKSIGHRLPELIRKAETLLGERGGIAAEKWNAGFWEMVTRSRERTETATRRRATARPR
jgi:hypothetical protein